MPQSTKYDWMLQRWAEQNDILPKDSPDLTPADPNEAQLAQQKEPKPEPIAQPQPQQGVAQPQQPVSEPEDDTEQVSEMVGIVKPWEKVDLYLDNWEYRVWEGWIGGSGPEADQKAEVLQDVLHQFDNNATMTKGPSKSDPNAITYSFKFSLGGNPDGIVDAVTKINEAFLALDNYKVISGKLYAIVYYADGEENTMDLTPQLRDSKGQPKGVDINDAVEMTLNAVTEGHAPESQWERPKVCPECGEKMLNSNNAIAQHYIQYHPNADVGKVYQEEITKMEEEIGRQARPSAGQQHLIERMGDEMAPESEIIGEKGESMQFCQKCGSVLGSEERGWSVCMRCVNDINQGKEPGSWKSVGQTLASKPEADVCKNCGTDAPLCREGYCQKCHNPPYGNCYNAFKTEGMPDLSYRSSPMGVESVKTDEGVGPEGDYVLYRTRRNRNRPRTGDLPTSETTEFDESGRPIYPKWEDDALEKVDKILFEVEDIFSEHEFYVRIRDMLTDLAQVVDMINEPTAEPAPQTPTPAPEPEVKLPPQQSQRVGPKGEENKQRAVGPSGGQPHNYVMGEMGKCAICGLPMTHYAHYGY